MRCAVAVVSLVMGLLAQQYPLAAAKPAAAEGVRQSVVASFVHVGPSRCIATRVFVSADVVRGTIPSDPRYPPPTPGAQIAITREDRCAGTTLTSASGSVAFRAGEADKALRVQDALKHAKLRATIPVVDFVSGGSFEVRVDLVWKGEGAAERVGGAPTLRDVRGPTSSLYREAVASGRVASEQTDFAPAPSRSASMTSATYRADGAGTGRSDARLRADAAPRPQPTPR